MDTAARLPLDGTGERKELVRGTGEGRDSVKKISGGIAVYVNNNAIDMRHHRRHRYRRRSHALSYICHILIIFFSIRYPLRFMCILYLRFFLSLQLLM